MILPRPLKTLLATVTVFALLSTAAQACIVPVFRYALENWPADSMDIAVFLPKPASADERALLDHVKTLQKNQAGPINGDVWEFETGADMPEWAKKVWALEAAKAEGKPWIVLVDNNGRGDPRILDQGVLTAATFASMFDSPARRQAASDILSGKAWAWIIVSDDPAARAELEQKLAVAMEEVRKNVELPSVEEMLNDPERPNRPMSPLPLKLEASVLFIDPADPAEKGFLAQTKHQSQVKTSGPALYAVFGQGRVIGPLVDKELDKASLLDLAIFLAGPCACQIKELNPGFDVLIAADWWAAFDEPGSVAIVGLQSDPVLFPPKPDATSGKASDEEQFRPRWAREAMVFTMLGGLVLVLLALAVIRRRQSPPR